jgi:hypothetical protein
MLGNDVDGDCVVAATEHLEMVHHLAVTSTWKKLLYRLGFKPPSTKFTVALYTKFLASLGEKGPLTGIYPGQWFPWLKAQGIITDWKEIPTDAVEIKQAMIDWKGCVLSLALTSYAYNNTFGNVPWEIRGPEDTANPNLEHAVALVTFDETDYGVVTWGRMKSMTDQFFSTCVNGCWVFK